MGSNWLVLTDAYSKYPCIHPTTSVSAKATIGILEQEFAHFGYPLTLVTDNAPAFKSEEFQVWCKSNGITHLSGAPYHPTTNGAAERLIQTFKQALRKSELPPRKALNQFLMQFRRMPNSSSGYSPSELLNSRQLRTKIDLFWPVPAQIMQERQQSTLKNGRERNNFRPQDKVFATLYGSDGKERFVPGIVINKQGNYSFEVKTETGICKRHIDQLLPRA